MPCAATAFSHKYQMLFGISLGKQTVMVQQKCQSNHAVPGHRNQELQHTLTEQAVMKNRNPIVML